VSFADECSAWREWAKGAINGTNVQIASAGDAAALTNWLGSVNQDDSVAAGHSAAEAAASSADCAWTHAWRADRFPVQSPFETYHRLTECGWTPVPQHSHKHAHDPPSGEPTAYLSAWRASRWFGTMQDVQKPTTGQKIAKEVGFFAGDGLVSSLLFSGIAGSIAGKPKVERQRVWKDCGKSKYLVAPDRILFELGAKWAKFPFSELIDVGFATDPKPAVELLMKDDALVHLRLVDADLHSQVLRDAWERYWLGRLSEKGREVKAIADSDDLMSAGEPAWSIGHTFKKMGYVRGASTYFEKASRCPNPETSAKAFLDLGRVWFGQLDWDRARDALTRAADTADVDIDILALTLLNLVLVERRAGDLGAAIVAGERARGLNCESHRMGTLHLLALSYAESNQHELASQTYAEVIASKHTEYAPAAAFAYAMLLMSNGENVLAANTLYIAASSDHKDWGPRGCYWLGSWYAGWGDPDTARTYLERAAESGHETWTPKAMELLNTRQLRQTAAAAGSKG
jgi:tetratricopeptide (TPR) repeat protein